jgi:hypothetical protein
MNALLIFMRILEALFLIGLAGSAIVVAISFVEDLWVLLGLDKHEQKPPAPVESNGAETRRRAELQQTPMHSAR